MVDKWEQIRDILSAEAAGAERPPRLRSQRTLFGIPSEIEQIMANASQEGTRAARDKKQGQARSSSDNCP
ncbi:MAG: hypothetical protein K6F70_03175 [Eggerthellaceae bacterium]|nr:hypothetical protein [Eggerthellaceae bacterium]